MDTTTAGGSRGIALSRVMRRITALIVLVLAIGLALAGPASAHAVIVTTEPGIDQVVDTSPDRVLIQFSEPVEIAFGAVRVFDTNAERVDAGEAAHTSGAGDTVSVPLKADLADGTYTVAWRAISADSHPVQGAFVFHVGAPGTKPGGIGTEVLGGGRPVEGALFGVSRWASFMSMLLLCGALFFAALVWRTRPVEEEPSPGIEAAFTTRWRSVVRWAWLGALIGSVMCFILEGAVAGEVSFGKAVMPSVLTEVADLRYGKVMLLRIGLLAIGALLWPLTRARSASLLPEAGRSAGAAELVRSIPTWAWIVAAAFSVALLATPGLAGHAGTTSPVGLNVVADTLHMTAAAAWMGGLATLLLAGFPAVKSLRDDDAVSTMAPVVARFSDLAVIAVGALTVTGVYRAWMEVGAWRALTGATYGIVLLTKIGVFLPLVALGAINNRYLKPRMTDDTKQLEERGTALGKLRRMVGIEVALGVIVVAITALLVNLPPAKTAAGVTGPFITDVKLGQDNLNVLVDPNEVGNNEVHLTLTSSQGAPVPLKGMEVEFTVPSKGLGPIPGKGKKLAIGHYVVQGNQLSVPGTWTLEIIARTSRFDEERVDVQVQVNG